jgi:YcxB-like protein
VSAPVEFEYAPTADELYDALSATAAWSTILVSIAMVFSVPVVCYAIFVWKYPAEAWSFAALLALYLATAGVAAGLFLWYLMRRLRRLTRRQSEVMRSDLHQVSISPAGIEMRSSNAESLLRWSAFAGVRETKRNVVLRLRGGGTIAMPLRYLDAATRRLIVDAVSPSTADTSRAAS